MKEDIEKVYHFTVNTGNNKENHLFVSESNLTDWQKDLLIGELLKSYNELPTALQQRFKDLHLK